MSTTAKNALALLREQGHTQKEAEMILAADAYHNYHDGNGICDDELHAAVKVFRDIDLFLKTINDRKFDLFHDRIRHDLDAFKGYKNARKNPLKG